MKVNLVVTAAGSNKGRAIPIVGAKFLIGRDPHCNLRPASQAVSKQHCAIHIRNGKIILEDFGSTNGSIVNGEAVINEREIKQGDHVKIGPLEFELQIIPSPTQHDGTPLPEKMKALESDTVAKLQLAAGQPLKPVLKSSPSGVSPMPKPAPQPLPKAPVTGDGDDAAAMLLGMDYDAPSGEVLVPEGSTVMEIPAVDAAGRLIPPKKVDAASPESSSAASDLLKKYFRRTS